MASIHEIHPLIAQKLSETSLIGVWFTALLSAKYEQAEYVADQADGRSKESGQTRNPPTVHLQNTKQLYIQFHSGGATTLSTLNQLV